MDRSQIDALIVQLNEKANGRMTVTFEEGRVVFRGSTGEHSLEVSVSSPHRIKSHFTGFLAAQPQPEGAEPSHFHYRRKA
jgi:hypothetical protein